MRTDAGRNPLPRSAGDHYWGGAQGKYFWVYPKKELYMGFMTRAPAVRLAPPVFVAADGLSGVTQVGIAYLSKVVANHVVFPVHSLSIML